jgi:hypothetical protein
VECLCRGAGIVEPPVAHLWSTVGTDRRAAHVRKLEASLAQTGIPDPNRLCSILAPIGEKCRIPATHSRATTRRAAVCASITAFQHSFLRSSRLVFPQALLGHEP